MSDRGLKFFHDWVSRNVDQGLNYRRWDRRAHILAMACRIEATSRFIGVQEMEDEVGELEGAFTSHLDGRWPALPHPMAIV